MQKINGFPSLFLILNWKWNFLWLCIVSALTHWIWHHFRHYFMWYIYLRLLISIHRVTLDRVSNTRCTVSQGFYGQKRFQFFCSKQCAIISTHNAQWITIFDLKGVCVGVIWLADSTAYCLFVIDYIPSSPQKCVTRIRRSYIHHSHQFLLCASAHSGNKAYV